MPEIRERDGSFWLYERVKIDGNWKYKKPVRLESVSKKEAKDEADKIRLRRRDSSLAIDDPGRDIHSLYEEYLASLENANTRRTTPVALKPFVNSFKKLGEFTPKRVVAWKAYLQGYTWKRKNGDVRHYARDTVSQRLRVIKQFGKWLVDQEMVSENPCKVKIEKGREDAGRILPPHLVQAFFEAIDTHYPKISLFTKWVFTLGGRLGETLLVQYSHIDRRRKEWVIPESKGHTGDTVALPTWLLAEIPNRKEGMVFPFGEWVVRHAWKQAAEIAGIKGRFRIHDGRVNFASYHFRSNRNLKGVMKQGRWKTEAMALHYIKMTDSQQREEAENLKFE